MIYQNKFGLKVTIVAVAVLIGVVSVYYTNTLVDKLVAREKAQIELYAQALKYTIDPENDQPITFIFQEIISANTSIPVIMTDFYGNIIGSRNIDFPLEIDKKEEKQRLLAEQLVLMKKEHPPIIIELGKQTKSENRNLIYHRNSFLINQLKYYPYAQLTIITIFGSLAYLAFSYSRRAEQNRVWVGLAKETAHQLGTPISSLMAWVEYFKADENFSHLEVLPEIEKDIVRLEMITARFSNIGSRPTLTNENILTVVKDTINYLKPRISPKVEIMIINYLMPETIVKMNRNLIEWVVENLCKNAVDAMNSAGNIEIKLNNMPDDNLIFIDVTDTGKGMPKSQMKMVFTAGFTSKKRGWGLGLTLAKRIVEDYHKGKIFVKSSEINKGTCFRIILPKELKK